MISDSIIVAVITGCVTAIGSLLGFVSAEKNRRKQVSDGYQQQLDAMEARLSKQISDDKAEYMAGISEVRQEIQEMKDIRADMKKDWEKTEVAIVDRINALEKAQNKHNQIIERTYKLESDVNVLTEKVSSTNTRVDILENHENRNNQK